MRALFDVEVQLGAVAEDVSAIRRLLEDEDGEEEDDAET